MRRRALKLALLGMLAAGLWFGQMELTVSGEFQVLPVHNADVRAQVEAIVAEVLVAEGDWVEAGQEIARLSARDYRAQRRSAEAEIKQKQAELRLLLAGTRDEEIALAEQAIEAERVRHDHAQKRLGEAQRRLAEEISKARKTVEKTQQQLSYAEKEWRRLEALREKKIISEMRLDEVRRTVDLREKELEEAQADLKIALADDLGAARQELAAAEQAIRQAEAELTLLLAGSRPEDIEAARAEIDRLEAQRDYAQELLAAARVTSPIAGVVSSAKPWKMVGQLVEQGDLILAVHDTSIVLAEISVSEKEIGDGRLGQSVVLKARAYPALDFTGTVVAIAPSAMDSQDGLRRKVLRVTTEIANRDLLLKPEMTGYGKIYCGERRLIDVLTRRLVRYIRVEFWSWW